jgi:hypothetical protein
LIWEISERKIRQYLLNISHRDGGPKALFFRARGFSDTDWEVLDEALRQHPIDNAIEGEEQTEFGSKMTVLCQIRTPDGSNPCIRTVWMTETGTVARLVTAYPSRR